MNRSLAYAAATITLGLTACTAAAPASTPTTTSPTPTTAPTTPSTTTPAPTTTLPPTTTAAPTTTLDPMIEFQAVLDRYSSARDVCGYTPEECDMSSVVKSGSDVGAWYQRLIARMMDEGSYFRPEAGSSTMIEKVLRISPSRVSVVYCAVTTEVDMFTHGTPDRSDDTPFSSGSAAYRLEYYFEMVGDTWLATDRAVLGHWFGDSACPA